MKDEIHRNSHTASKFHFHVIKNHLQRKKDGFERELIRTSKDVDSISKFVIALLWDFSHPDEIHWTKLSCAEA